MRGASMIKRVAGALTVTAALAGASAAQAPAFVLNGPGCAAHLAVADYGAKGSCHFTTDTDYTSINVVVDGTVTVTLSCNDNGYVRTRSRTFTANGGWSTYAVGQCQMILTSGATGTTAVAVAVPAINPNPVP